MGGEGREEGVRVEYICLEQEAKPAGGTKTKPGLVESIGRQVARYICMCIYIYTYTTGLALNRLVWRPTVWASIIVHFSFFLFQFVLRDLSCGVCARGGCLRGNWAGAAESVFVCMCGGEGCLLTEDRQTDPGEARALYTPYLPPHKAGQVSHGFVRHAWERTPCSYHRYLEQKHIEFVSIGDDELKETKSCNNSTKSSPISISEITYTCSSLTLTTCSSHLAKQFYPTIISKIIMSMSMSMSMSGGGGGVRSHACLTDSTLLYGLYLGDSVSVRRSLYLWHNQLTMNNSLVVGSMFGLKYLM